MHIPTINSVYRIQHGSVLEKSKRKKLQIELGFETLSVHYLHAVLGYFNRKLNYDYFIYSFTLSVDLF